MANSPAGGCIAFLFPVRLIHRPAAADGGGMTRLPLRQDRELSRIALVWFGYRSSFFVPNTGLSEKGIVHLFIFITS
jgi:hypothetical protein